MEHPRGRLKIYMGYAAGVGKTFQMLEDARELQAKGVDIVVGYFEPHNRPDTIAKAQGLEFVPRKKVSYRGSEFEEMDAEAILARRPQVAVVDEFPHTNVPGCGRAKRWEDVEALLDAGIDVLTTMNIQHLESLNDQVFEMTGVRVRETIPDWVVQGAGQVVMIDLTPRALLHRLERGAIYGREKAERAAQNFFRESTLAALRELALRQTAHEVDSRMPAAAADRILIHVTGDPRSAMLIRRAKRVADFLGAECFAAVVEGAGDDAVERHLNFARNLHIETRVLEGEDTAQVLVEFARRNRIGQIFLARPRERGLRLGRNLAQKIVALAADMQVVIVSERDAS